MVPPNICGGDNEYEKGLLLFTIEIVTIYILFFFHGIQIGRHGVSKKSLIQALTRPRSA